MSATSARNYPAVLRGGQTGVDALEQPPAHDENGCGAAQTPWEFITSGGLICKAIYSDRADTGQGFLLG
jgi:hypothetical protein